MNGENPYAPPAVAETETKLSSSGDGWKLFGPILLVHKGATLPKIDLETGVSDPSLKLYRCPHTWLFGHSDSFWRYSNPRRIFFYRVRSIIRDLLFWPLLILLIWFPNLYEILPSFSSGYFHFEWPFAILILHFTWHRLDRPKLRITESPKPGWLRVTEVHPNALSYLRGIAKPTSSS